MKDIVFLPIENVKPYENNPRHNEDAVDKVAASLREFGWRQPIVVDKDNVVIAGHTRLLAAKRLKMPVVPVTIADDLTAEQVTAYRLADNKTAEFAEWDFELLASELDDIADIDMTQFGFDLDLDDSFLKGADDEDPDDVSDEVETRAKQGDIWLLGEHRLICGDSTDVAVIDALTDGETVDLVFTDPPYGINAVNDEGTVIADGQNHLAQRGKYEKIVGDDTTDTAQAAYDLLSQICDRLILWGGNYFTEFLPFSDSWLIWDKRGDSGIRNNFADGEMAWCSFHTPVRIYHQLWNGMIREGEHEKRVHPTQKPIRMLSEIITDFSAEGDLVLDVFGGSGSTMIACEHTGRRCFMCELSERYCDIIISRWEQLTGLEAERITEGDESEELPF